MTGPGPDTVLVLGVGNVLVGDEGIGVRVVQELLDQELPEHIHVVDGGTGGFHLLGYLRDYKRIILVDATRDGEPAGTVSHFVPRQASDFPPSLGAHDIGLKDLISATALLGPLPDITVVTISIEELKPMSMELSHEVEASISVACATVKEILQL